MRLSKRNVSGSRTLVVQGKVLDVIPRDDRILMMNLHALRTQNWEEFKGSLRLMLPWMQIYDNDKYGKWMAEYWLEISNLPDEKAAYVREGLFAQSMTGNLTLVFLSIFGSKSQ